MRRPLFSRDDLSGFWALFADNLTNLIIIAGLCKFVLHIPDDILYGRVFPGLGVSLLLGLSFYVWLARRLAVREGRWDVTALPYGISTPVLFVYGFGVMLPVYAATHDGVLTWRVGVAAAFVGGVIEAAGALVGPWLKRITPRAGMLGTLAGIAICYIATVPLAEVFESPVVGFASMAIVFVGLVAAIELPGKLPAGLVAIVIGTLIGLVTGDAHIATDDLGAFHLPVPVLGDLVAGLRALFERPQLFAVILPVEIYNFLETMNNVESAEAAGDRYPVGLCQLMDGAGTMVGALFGGMFPTTVYIGHPGYKRLGARSGYALGVGVVAFIAVTTGLIAFLYALVPVAAVAPILVYIGVVIAAEAFRSTPRAHAMAVAIALIPHIAGLVTVKLGSLAAAFEAVGGSGLDLHSPALVAAMRNHGLHYLGQSALSAGAIVTGLLWGAMAAFLVDVALRKAAAFALAGGVLAFVGIIHHDTLGLYASDPIAWGYVVMAGVFFALGFFDLRRRDDLAA